ncbi:MAG TPA: hypothetical protein VG318_04880 [Actinomycetota bacterium]|nr:hypothetical protein [Actinomycetota bacterium]
MPDMWKQAPGAPRSSFVRSAARKLLGSLLVGALSVGMAWAGSGLIPVSSQQDALEDSAVPAPRQAPEGEGDVVAGGETPSLDLASGQLLAGAAKVSLRPEPERYGGVWEQNYDKCANLQPNPTGFQEGLMHVADFRVRWAENTDCIFMGGYGIGPMNPIVKWDDEYGLWARSVAMSDGTDTVVLTLIDAVYWEAHYANMCDGCGFLDLADKLAAETGLKPESFVFASTHSHTSPDFIGGWGGVPTWYMEQATASLETAATQAVAALEPAVLETGEILARGFNAERRDFYRSAEDDGLSWFRLVDADDQPSPEVCTTPPPSQTPRPGAQPFPTPSPTPVCTPASPGKAIATVGAYAAHPVTADESGGRADADFPAVFAARVEEAFGGVGMFLQTGLGNMSPRGDKIEMGNGLAALIPPIGGGTQITEPDVRVGRAFWDQPVTNVPLGGLGVAGFFDRKFNETPATVSEGKGPENRKCRSASPVSVRTSVSAAKIGSLWITGGPGELFSNLTNTIEERNPNGVTLALGLVNDGLGYIVQSFETDHAGRQGAGFVGTTDDKPLGNQQPAPLPPVGVAEYEDAYSIDHCFGDAVLENTIDLLSSLR